MKPVRTTATWPAAPQGDSESYHYCQVKKKKRTSVEEDFNFDASTDAASKKKLGESLQGSSQMSSVLFAAFKGRVFPPQGGFVQTVNWIYMRYLDAVF